jgi:hypothetical protein
VRYNKRQMSRLTTAGLIGKWIAIPAAVAAIGYFVVGPRMDDEGPLQQVLQRVAHSATGSDGAVATPTTPPGEPEIEVTVRRPSAASATTRRAPEPEPERPRRRTPRPQPTRQAAPAPAPPVERETEPAVSSPPVVEPPPPPVDGTATTSTDLS